MGFVPEKTFTPFAAPKMSFSGVRIVSSLSNGLHSEVFDRGYTASFKNLKARERDSLLVLANSVVVESGEVVVNAGTNSRQIYIVLEGSIAMMSAGTLITTLVAGDIFGESAFTTGDKEIFDFVADDGTELLAFKVTALTKLARFNSYFSSRLAASLAECMQKIIEKLNLKVC